MNECKRTTARILALSAATAVAFMTVSTPAWADNTTTVGAFCMQRVFMGPTGTVSSANLVNCTANDISVAKALSVSPAKCTAGTTIPLLTATFQVNVTANARYDAAFFFRTDGGANARGDGSTATGQCSMTQLDPAIAPAQNLDTDSCGDLNAGTYTNVTFTIPNVKCEDTNGDGFLNLPNCTSWHSNQGTACNRLDNNPFDASPDTKSKCVCDDTFQVPVQVEKGSITVTKDADTPSSLPEPGGQFAYTVGVTNDASVVSVTIDRICDDRYGLIAKVATAPACAAGTVGTIDSTDCVVPQTLQPTGQAGNSYTCHFKATFNGNSGASLTDTVTFFGHDQNNTSVQGSDAATVSITNVSPTAGVVKSFVSLACADVNYHVKVTNTDSGDASISLSSLIDNKFGDLTLTKNSTPVANPKINSTTCSLPQSLAKGGTPYECDFQAHFCAASNTDIVTAVVGDDEGGSGSFDSNAVTVNVCTTTGTGGSIACPAP